MANGFLFDKQLWDPKPSPKRAFRFFPHQWKAVAAILSHLEQAASCYAVSATGTGKTEMIVKLIQDYCAAMEGCVVISPRIELVGQTAERLRKRGIKCGIEQAQNESDEVVTVASYASLCSRRRRRGADGSFEVIKRADKFVGKVKLVIVDECHTNFTKSAKQLLDNFRDAGAKVVGFTATPRVGKADGLEDWYGKCVFAYTYTEARDDGFLVPAKLYMTVLEEFSLEGMYSGGDFNLNSLRFQQWCRQEKNLQPICQLIKQVHNDEPMAVFVARIDQANLLSEMLAREGLRCSIVHSRMESEEQRRDELRRFETGETNIIVNVGVLTMGWDFPPVRRLVIARHTAEIDFYTQMFGRALRPLPGVIDGLETAEERRAAIAASDKPYCEVFDICDASRHARLVTAIDVINPERRLLKTRRPPAPKEGTALLDPDAIVAREQEELRRQQQQEDIRRMSEEARLKARARFSYYERDPTADPESQDYRGPRYTVMMWGKHKRKPFHAVPTKYLVWTLDNCSAPKKHPGYFPALEKELKRRGVKR